MFLISSCWGGEGEGPIERHSCEFWGLSMGDEKGEMSSGGFDPLRNWEHVPRKRRDDGEEWTEEALKKLPSGSDGNEAGKLFRFRKKSRIKWYCQVEFIH